MHVPDGESVMRSMYPGGAARGWRRTGCLVMLIAALVLVISAAVIAALR